MVCYAVINNEYTRVLSKCEAHPLSTVSTHTHTNNTYSSEAFVCFSLQREEEINNIKPTTLYIPFLRRPLQIIRRTQAVPISPLSRPPPLILLPTNFKFFFTLLGSAIKFSQALSPKLSSRNPFQSPRPFANMPNGVEISQVPESILLHYFS